MYARTCVCIYLETGVLLCCPGWSPIPGRKIISASVLGVAGSTGMYAPLLVRFAYFCCLIPSIMIEAPQGSVSKSICGASEKTQWVEELTTKPGDLGLISKTQMGAGEKWLLQADL